LFTKYLLMVLVPRYPQMNKIIHQWISILPFDIFGLILTIFYWDLKCNFMSKILDNYVLHNWIKTMMKMCQPKTKRLFFFLSVGMLRNYVLDKTDAKNCAITRMKSDNLILNTFLHFHHRFYSVVWKVTWHDPNGTLLDVSVLPRR
jgi:hypothetical protein